MTDLAPRHVICAVRGGPESRETVTRAIGISLEHSARLTFLHIVDADFLEYATIGPLSVVYHELREMAAFTMLILCDRAERRGVEKVDYVILDGNIRDGLIRFANQTRAETMVMGRPTRSPGRNVFKVADLDELAAELERNHEIAIITVPTG